MNEKLKELCFLQELRTLAENGFMADLVFQMQSRIESLDAEIKKFEKIEQNK
jgi:hypothetical protein